MKKILQKTLQGVTELAEAHGEIFEILVGGYKPPFKLCVLRFSL